MLTRVWHAKDWESGIELRNYLLGKTSSLQVHHIFPKSLLYENGYSKSDVNAVANFTFLTQDTNLKVSNRDPKEYLKEYAEKHPHAIESHWIPIDPELWKIENYQDFIAARRELLAKAANEFLNSLFAGSVPETEVVPSAFEQPIVDIPGGFASEEEERIIKEFNEWIIELGLPSGEMLYELSDSTSGEPLAILDIAWPNGLQEGYSQPVALLIDEERETEEVVSSTGFRIFRDTANFKDYVLRDIVVADELAA
jgi:hypothetical protein